MPKFKVCLTRMVEETAEMTVEADTIEAAVDEAIEYASENWAEMKTEPGDWCEDVDAYWAENEDRTITWDWNDLEKAR